MMGQEFRLPLRNVRETGREFMRDPPMKLPPPRLQDRPKRRVTNERVFENVTRVWGRALLAKKVRANEAL